MIYNDEPIKIDLKKLQERFNPFKSNIWVKLNSPITHKEIAKYIKDKKFQSPDVEVKFELIWDVSSRDTHLKRIAWLVENFDLNFPIEIDVGIPSMGFTDFEIFDGNHRLIAALYRKEKYIKAYCSGSIEEIELYLYKETEKVDLKTMI